MSHETSNKGSANPDVVSLDCDDMARAYDAASSQGESRIESGKHLLLMRTFIQNRALNGSEVIWGSSDVVRFNSVTVDDLERLAQHIYDAGKRAQSQQNTKT